MRRIAYIKGRQKDVLDYLSDEEIDQIYNEVKRGVEADEEHKEAAKWLSEHPERPRGSGQGLATDRDSRRRRRS